MSVRLFLTVRRVNSQVDWKIADSLVTASHSVSLIFNLFHDGGKVHKLLSLRVKEFSILHWSVNELEDERPPGDNPGASWQEVPVT